MHVHACRVIKPRIWYWIWWRQPPEDHRTELAASNTGCSSNLNSTFHGATPWTRSENICTCAREEAARSRVLEPACCMPACLHFFDFDCFEHAAWSECFFSAQAACKARSINRSDPPFLPGGASNHVRCPRNTKPPARNTATDEQVQKLLRSNLTNLGTAYKETDMEMIVAGYESFICDFLKVSPRLVAKQLSRCAGRVFERNRRRTLICLPAKLRIR